MTQSKTTRMQQLLNHRLKVTMLDGRTLVGQMISFDKHMNLVLADCQECRKIKVREQIVEQNNGNSNKVVQKDAGQQNRTKTKLVEEKRMLGLVILRGETIETFIVESPPPKGDAMNRKAASAQNLVPTMMPGAMVQPMGRGVPPQGFTRPPLNPAAGMRPPMSGVMPPGYRPQMPPMGNVYPPGYRPPQHQQHQ
ncbi:hypothetical protein MIR68_002689 [Amoeboaphelidium protococcarum]|nr:hypothetical protein MIR68_002689 [Amoeboaphelidium protococcarum]